MIQGADHLPASVAVVEHVAEREGIDPLDLSPPLQAVIDPDALDRLCSGTASRGLVAFSYCGYTVTVTSDGVVSLEERPCDLKADDQVSTASATSD